MRNDAAGQGHFGAPRGSRTHNGVDIETEPGSDCLAWVSGTVTKLGYPYNGDMDTRYVEITDPKGVRFRVFYVEPMCHVGQKVKEGETLIGQAQDVTQVHLDLPDMTPHIHAEIMDGNEYIDPTAYIDWGG